MTIIIGLLLVFLARLYELVPARRSTGEIGAWTPKQVELIKQQICEGASDDELAFFAHVCEHRELDPFAGEIVGIMRWNGKEQRNVMKIQVTVEGLRTIAMRTGLYAGQDEILWCGEDGEWRDVWPDPDKAPYAAKAAVYRVDVNRPFIGKAHFHEFAQFDSKGRLTPMWQKMPANQLGKCAERQALIRAFKKELRAAGINVEDDLPIQSRVSMEARQAGLDDDGRHALVHDVTDGRTDSTRELEVPDEVLAFRSEVARRAAPVKRTAAGPGGTETYWVDPETGEFVDPPTDDAGTPGEVSDDAAGVEVLGPGSEAHSPIPNEPPGRAEDQAPAADEPAFGEVRRPDPPPVPMPQPRDNDRADIAALKRRIRTGMTDIGWAKLVPWLEACKINPSLDGISRPRVGAINAELDQRGVAAKTEEASP